MFPLCCSTNFGDAAQCRIQDDDLDEAREGRRDNLGHEHGSRRDLHVVTELQVGHEGEGLAHGDVAKRLEDHER